MRYVVGVDGGGTKTTATVVGEDLRVVGSYTNGSSNSRSVGEAQASANIAGAITHALAAANLLLADITAVGLCLAGFDTDLDLPVPQQALQQLGYHGAAILENDVVGAWAGATGAQPGVVVIAGTGSTAFGMNRQGRLYRTDGWDYILGDAGSGYDIGRSGIRLAMKAFDGRAAPTLLTGALKETYGVDGPEGMRRLVDQGHIGKMEIAAFAGAVARTADAGDVAARGILAQAGQDLAEQALAIIRALDMAQDDVLVATVGGVFHAVPWVQEPFRRLIQQQAPRARFQAPLHSPEVGAAILALRRLDEGDLGSWTLGTGRRHIERTCR
jgi:N-acetylglucosamine kinase-like BadF-type ATPase